jgi:hypothetical protein
MSLSRQRTKLFSLSERQRRETWMHDSTPHKTQAGLESASAGSASAGIVESLMTAQRSLRKSVHSLKTVCGKNPSYNTSGTFCQRRIENSTEISFRKNLTEAPKHRVTVI